MTWQCRLIDCVPGLNRDNLQIGDMFYWDETKHPSPEDSPNDDEGYYWYRALYRIYKTSQYYFQHNSHRPRLFVWLPGHTLFTVDGQTMSNGASSGGWSVTGEAPNITVSPSINIGGSYHGWIRDGVISDDCEGRRYDETGRRIPQ